MNHETYHPSEARLLTDRLRDSVAPGKRFDKSQSVSERDGNLQMVVEGAVLRQRMLADGRTQTVAIYYRDDVVNLSRFVRRCEGNDNLLALRGTVIASVEPQAVAAFRQMSLTGIDGMAALVLRELCIAQERLLSLGQRSAIEAMAHFLCEALVRNRGPNDNQCQDRCALALTQDLLASLLGLSSVHINRTLQAIRSLGLADHVNSELIVHDFDSLAELGQFDDGYLKPV